MNTMHDEGDGSIDTAEKQSSLVAGFKKELDLTYGKKREVVAALSHSQLAAEDGVYRKQILQAIPQKYLTAENLKIYSMEGEPDSPEAIYPQGSKFYLAALPFTEQLFGETSMREDGTWQDFLGKNGFSHEFVETFETDEERNAHEGLSTFNGAWGRFHKLLCPQLRKDVADGGCSFEIKYPYQNDPLRFYDNKQWFLDQYEKALENLVRFLNAAN